MNITDAPAEALNLLREHEEAISRLYAAYARRFPADRDFWLSLSQEESQHASWIGLLRERTEEESSGLIVNRFPAAAITHSLNYISRLIEGANRPDLTPVNALSAALDIEQALLENRYFEVFDSNSAEVRRVLELLAQETRAHIEKVRYAWQNRKAHN